MRIQYRAMYIPKWSPIANHAAAKIRDTLDCPIISRSDAEKEQPHLNVLADPAQKGHQSALLRRSFQPFVADTYEFHRNFSFLFSSSNFTSTFETFLVGVLGAEDLNRKGLY